MPVSPEQYDASVTGAAIAGLRAAARSTATALIAAGIEPHDVAVTWRTVEISRRFLGFPVTDRVRDTEVLLHGWPLAEVTTVQGTMGDTWRLHTVAAALGDDGELYRVERHREEKGGRPTADDGAATVTPLADADLPLFDHLDPPNFAATPAPGYWALFPERLRAALAGLGSA